MIHRAHHTLNFLLIAALLFGSLQASVRQVRAAQPSPASSLSPAANDWAPLSTGTNGVDQYNMRSVNAIAITSTGDVIAGGNFETMGECITGCTGIARWNPGTSSWSPIDSGISGVVESTAIGPSGIIYAGGQVFGAGACTSGLNGKCNGIAQWNPSTGIWSGMESGVGEGGRVKSIAIDPNNGTVYAGGNFYPVGKSIAQWNGTSWSTVGGGIEWDVYAVAVGSSSIVYAGGGASFAKAGTCTNADGCNNIAQWDGTSWSALSSGVNGPVNTIAISPKTGFVYVGGSFSSAGASCDSAAGCNNIAQWDPVQKTWSAVGTGINGTINSLAFDKAGTLFAGGLFSSAGSCTYAAGCSGIAQWDGTTWSSLNSGIEPVVFAIAPNSGIDIYVGGWFNKAGSCPGPGACWGIAKYHNGPPPATITFDPAPSPTYLTDTSFTVLAHTTNTDTNGDVLTYSADSGPCTQVGTTTTFTITGAGDCVVRAEGAETATFGASSNTLTVTIDKAQPVITFTSPAFVRLISHSFTATATTTNTDPDRSMGFEDRSGPCTHIADGLFLIYDKGTCLIRASSPETTNFKSATKQQTVSISGLIPYYLPIVAAVPITQPWFVTLGYEDLAISSPRIDYDYNDWGVDVSGTTSLSSDISDLVHEIDLAFTPRTRGAGYDHSFGIALPANTFSSGGYAFTRIYDQNHALISSRETRFEAGSPATFPIFDKTSEVFPGERINTIEWVPTVLPQRTATLSLTFDQPVMMTQTFTDPHGAGLFFDPYLTVPITGEEVHQGDLRLLSISAATYKSVSSSVAPWQWVEEGVRIDRAYPLVSFVPGNPPAITFPTNWWVSHTQCVVDGLACVQP